MCALRGEKPLGALCLCLLYLCMGVEREKVLHRVPLCMLTVSCEVFVTVVNLFIPFVALVLLGCLFLFCLLKC